MKTRIIIGLAVVGAAILASCSQDRSPSTLLPTQASFGKAVTCSNATANNDAKAYFADSRDSVFTYLDIMKNDLTKANSAGFDALARLGIVTDAGALKSTATPALGSKFANDVLLCMSVSGYNYSVDFSQALSAGGLFTLRDGSSTAAVTSRTSDANGPLFGAEPQPTGSTWPLGQRTLFYGWPVSALKLAGEGVAGNVFELRTLPSGLTFTAPIRAGVCSITNETARILHLHASDPAVILPQAGRPDFCTPLPSTGMAPTTSPFSYAMRTIGNWIAPQPAYASRTMMFGFGGGGGGLVSGLSEIGPVTFTGVLAFANPPKNSSVSLHPQFPDTVKVSAKSSNGNALAGVPITLSVTGNNSVIVFPDGNTATTDNQGIAKFPNLYINKAGGYTMTAGTGDFTGTATTRFQINGQ